MTGQHTPGSFVADKVHPWLIVEGKFRSPFDKLQPNCAVETNQEKNKYHLIMEQAHFPPDGTNFNTRYKR